MGHNLHYLQKSFAPSGRGFLEGETRRYSDCRVTPSSVQGESTHLGFPQPRAAMARRSLAGVTLNGRPPVLPRARAADSPATVRSEMSARSNAARVAKYRRRVSRMQS